MKIRWDIIAFWACAGLLVLFVSLISVWPPFAIFAGFSLLGAAGIYTSWQYVKYKRICNAFDEQRYEDAYVYADENNLNFNPKEFRYSKKEEREIKRYKSNAKLLVFVGFGMIILALFLIIYPFFVLFA